MYMHVHSSSTHSIGTVTHTGNPLQGYVLGVLAETDVCRCYVVYTDILLVLCIVYCTALGR